jgi:LacI family transcriptional regulator
MKDVAALAGVGLTSVSRVFNAEPSVAEEIAARVFEAAAQLNYQPNRAASDLRRRDGRPSTIGLLIQDVSNQFSASIFRAVENVAGKHAVSVLCSNLDESVEREHALTANLIARRVNGLMIVPSSHDHSYLQHEPRSGTPIVFLDRPPQLLSADSVVSDNRLGSLTGVVHLAQHGHRRIGYLGETSAFEPARMRYEGYVHALREVGIKIDNDIIRRELHTEEDGRIACRQVLAADNPPTALFAGHNRLTVGAIHALRELGCERSVALVGFDDLELFDVLDPGITVVAQNPLLIGTIGAEILFNRMHGDQSPVQQRVVPTRLVERGSGEISPR